MVHIILHVKFQVQHTMFFSENTIMQSNRIEPAVMLCYVMISVQALFKTFMN